MRRRWYKTYKTAQDSAYAWRGAVGKPEMGRGGVSIGLGGRLMREMGFLDWLIDWQGEERMGPSELMGSGLW